MEFLKKENPSLPYKSIKEVLENYSKKGANVISNKKGAM